MQAGELVFESPLGGGTLAQASSDYEGSLYVRDPKWHEFVRPPVAQDGTLPFYRYVIEKKGEVRVGILSCAMCHTRVMPDGSVIKGAQGNLPFDRAFAFDYRFGGGSESWHRRLERLLYHGPPRETSGDQTADEPTTDEIAARHEAIPAGVLARHRASPQYPVVVPDLFEIADRRYLDRTGLQQHRDLGDLMRYAALNQGGDDLSEFNGFVPLSVMLGFVPPAAFNRRGRYSDEQLYALALYVHSLKPPENPHLLDDLAARGREIFETEGCVRCHTPPLYTSNKLTPAEGFEIPRDHREKYGIEEQSLGTHPSLALATHRGTGYYKIPSLRHVWARGPLGHDGSCATLEDWFDPRRLEDDYEPTGFRGEGISRRAVPGHEYGLDLTEDDRRALIAFLRTL